MVSASRVRCWPMPVAHGETAFQRNPRHVGPDFRQFDPITARRRHLRLVQHIRLAIAYTSQCGVGFGCRARAAPGRPLPLRRLVCSALVLYPCDGGVIEFLRRVLRRQVSLSRRAGLSASRTGTAWSDSCKCSNNVRGAHPYRRGQQGNVGLGRIGSLTHTVSRQGIHAPPSPSSQIDVGCPVHRG
jgi:hypothetical protein